jgi:gluconolactonase
MPDNVLCEGLGFPEGPVWGKDGQLYVTEIKNGQITRVDPNTGAKSVFATTGGGPNGANFGPDGNLYVTNDGGFAWDGENPNVPAGRADDYETGRIERIYPDGRVERVYGEYEGQPLGGPNDLVFDQEGNFYFTDPGNSPHGAPLASGRVFYATLDGKSLTQLDEGYQFSNGICLSPDGRTLIVAESVTGKLWAYDVTGPGQVSNKREFATLPRGGFPDGGCVDADGNVIWGSVVGAGGLATFDANGGSADFIELEDPYCTNVCFGGPGFDTLYVTQSTLGRVVTLKWRNKGLVLFPDR